MSMQQLVAVVVLAWSCGAEHAVEDAVRVERKPFGTLPTGDQVESYTIANANGISLTAITYGAMIVSLHTPDRNGKTGDIVLGFDSLAGYVGDHPYFGAVVGRYANRIARGTFTLDGTTYTLATNNAPNHLHGGDRGFDARLWAAEAFHDADRAGVVFRYTSPDGEEGYPGTLQVTVTYTLTTDDTFVIDYHAVTDAATPVNLSQHTYFNLTGDPANDVLDHVLTINADRFTPVDSTLIPYGNLEPVSGTPFDFTTPHTIGARITDDHAQLRYGGGYDHNFVLVKEGDELSDAVTVIEPSTGRVLTIATTEPGMQFYSGNFLDGSIVGKGGRSYARRTGFCLESQHYPDSPNQPEFPSVILLPGGEYRSRTVWRFSTTP